MHDIFRNGGLGTYPTAFLGLLLLAIAIRYAVKPDQRWIPLQVALGITTLATGFASFVTGAIVTLNAVGMEASGGLDNVGETASRAEASPEPTTTKALPFRSTSSRTCRPSAARSSPSRSAISPPARSP